MKTKMFCALALAAALMAPAGASALEADWGTKKGDWEMNLSGFSDSYTFKGEDFKYTNTRIQGTLGYFLTDGIETGLILSTRNNTSSSGQSGTVTQNTVSPRLFGAFHFNLPGNFTPFAGLYAEMQNMKNTESGNDWTRDETAFGLMAGVKYFFSEWAALTGQLEGDMRTVKITNGSKTYDVTRFGFMFGISVFF